MRWGRGGEDMALTDLEGAILYFVVIELNILMAHFSWYL